MPNTKGPKYAPQMISDEAEINIGPNGGIVFWYFGQVVHGSYVLHHRITAKEAKQFGDLVDIPWHRIMLHHRITMFCTIVLYCHTVMLHQVMNSLLGKSYESTTWPSVLYCDSSAILNANPKL